MTIWRLRDGLAEVVQLVLLSMGRAGWAPFYAQGFTNVVMEEDARPRLNMGVCVFPGGAGGWISRRCSLYGGAGSV